MMRKLHSITFYLERQFMDGIFYAEYYWAKGSINCAKENPDYAALHPGYAFRFVLCINCSPDAALA